MTDDSWVRDRRWLPRDSGRARPDRGPWTRSLTAAADFNPFRALQLVQRTQPCRQRLANEDERVGVVSPELAGSPHVRRAMAARPAEAAHASQGWTPRPLRCPFAARGRPVAPVGERGASAHARWVWRLTREWHRSPRRALTGD